MRIYWSLLLLLPALLLVGARFWKEYTICSKEITTWRLLALESHVCDPPLLSDSALADEIAKAKAAWTDLQKICQAAALRASDNDFACVFDHATSWLGELAKSPFVSTGDALSKDLGGLGTLVVLVAVTYLVSAMVKALLDYYSTKYRIDTSNQLTRAHLQIEHSNALLRQAEDTERYLWPPREKRNSIGFQDVTVD